MKDNQLSQVFDITGSTAVVTGGAGVLCAEICRTLAAAGARIAIADLDSQRAEELADQIRKTGREAQAVGCDVLSRASIESAAQRILREFGQVDILINGAGGNHPQASTSAELSFFDLPVSILSGVIDLNLLGTILPCQVFGPYLADRGSGTILNISSMNAIRPLTRIPAYSAAKAGVSNFTSWLAVHMAQVYSPAIRVNAIAPGFFLTEQNRFLLIDQTTGELTDRGRAIIDHTPQNRFGEAADLAGTVLWLVSPAAAFVTGIVVPVDGGFSAFSGV